MLRREVPPSENETHSNGNISGEPLPKCLRVSIRSSILCPFQHCHLHLPPDLVNRFSVHLPKQDLLNLGVSGPELIQRVREKETEKERGRDREREREHIERDRRKKKTKKKKKKKKKKKNKTKEMEKCVYIYIFIYLFIDIEIYTHTSYIHTEREPA